MHKKKLLFIIHSSAPSGGAEDDIENLLIKLRETGDYEIHGLLPEGPRKDSFLRYLDRHGNLNWGVFPVINKGILDYVKYFLKSFIQFAQIKKFVKGVKYDNIMISVAVLLWPIIFLKLYKNKNIVFIKETIEPKFVRKILYRIIGYCSEFVIPNSRIIEDEFTKITGNHNIKTVYSSVSRSEYDITKENLYEEKIGKANILALKENSIKLLMIGNLIKIKNPIAAVETVELLNNNSELPTKLFIVGKEDVEINYAHNLKNYIKINKLDDKVFILGFQTKEVIEYLLQKIDFLIIPSLSEGIPLVLVYALKFKVPVITTAVGGISDIIKDNINGIIIKPNAHSIYDNVKRIYKNPELKELIRNNGYETFIKYFNLERNLNEIHHLISSLN